MNIEEKLRGALDVPAPPPTTTLDVVLRRGRRRVFARRAGAVLGVFAVVAGVGVGATTLNLAAPPAGPAGNVDEDLGPAEVVHEVGWTRVDLPPRVPPNPGQNCDEGRQPSSVGHQRLTDKSMRDWRNSVGRVVSGAALVDSPQVEDVVDVFEVEIRDSLGAGTVRLAAGTYSGSPVTAANDAAWATTACDPPQRSFGQDGTVFQLYDVRRDASTESVARTLFVFRPDGKAFRIDQSNVGTNSTRATRAALPLTTEQFKSLGPAVAALG
jgi:hypothetical protein